METIIETLEKEIEKVKEEMCDNYCKMPHQFANVEIFDDMTDDDKMQFLEEICDKCPLGRLL